MVPMRTKVNEEGLRWLTLYCIHSLCTSLLHEGWKRTDRTGGKGKDGMEGEVEKEEGKKGEEREDGGRKEMRRPEEAARIIRG